MLSAGMFVVQWFLLVLFAEPAEGIHIQRNPFNI